MFLTSSVVLLRPTMSRTKIVARQTTPIKVFTQKSTMLDRLESSNVFSARCENGNAAHLKLWMNILKIFMLYRSYVNKQFNTKTYANRINKRQTPARLSLAT